MKNTITADPDYLALQDQLDYLVDCGMERSAAADAVRAKLRLLRGSYKMSEREEPSDV